MTPFERRVARLEAAKRAQRPAPFVLRVAPNETHKSARARFDTQWPGHARTLLIVPLKPRDESEELLWATRFYDQQNELVRKARSERIAAENVPTNDPRRSPFAPIANRPSIKWRKPDGSQS